MNNFFEVMQKMKQFQEFKRQIEASGRDPAAILEEEIKKRGITQEQLRQLTDMAKSFNNLIKRY